eukprot:scaffold26.g3344.t1
MLAASQPAAGLIRACGGAVAAGSLALLRGLAQQSRGLAGGVTVDGDKLTVEVNPYKSHNIEPPSNEVTTDKAELLGFFREMYRMRRMEISADMLYKAKQIRGFCHLYDGQEAVSVGMHAVLTMQDSLITSYRDHAIHLNRGGTVLEVIAELMGKVEGASKVGEEGRGQCMQAWHTGKGGSMHMFRGSTNFYGGQGIVGAQACTRAALIAVFGGLALGHSYLEDGSVAVAMYGDGAANQGQVFEAFNIASLWNLPCIFICENNHYGMGTAEWRAAKSPAFYSRGDYMPGLKVDGMDVLAVKQATAFAKDHVLKVGPMILEMDTYRYHGHSMSDPGSTYRSRDEITNIRQQRDPIEHVRKLLVDNGLAEASELKAIEKDVKKEVDSAIEAAKASPPPGTELLFKDVYVDGLGMTLRNIDRANNVKLP